MNCRTQRATKKFQCEGGINSEYALVISESQHSCKDVISTAMHSLAYGWQKPVYLKLVLLV